MKLCPPVAAGPRTQESTIRGPHPQRELCSMSEQNHTTQQVLFGRFIGRGNGKRLWERRKKKRGVREEEALNETMLHIQRDV